MIIAEHENASRNSSRVRRIQNSKRGAISVSRCSQCGLRPVEILIYTDELHMFPFRHYTSTYPFSKSLCENDVIIALPQTRIVCMQIEKILASFSAIISSLLLISPRDRSREKEGKRREIKGYARLVEKEKDAPLARIITSRYFPRCDIPFFISLSLSWPLINC